MLHQAYIKTLLLLRNVKTWPEMWFSIKIERTNASLHDNLKAQEHFLYIYIYYTFETLSSSFFLFPDLTQISPQNNKNSTHFFIVNKLDDTKVSETIRLGNNSKTIHIRCIEF